MNQEILKKLYSQKNQEKYARITTLTLDEFPIDRIEGKITNSGSITIDGSSAMRRTCSFTMVSETTNYEDYDWALNTKFKLEIGLRLEENG